MTWLKLKVMYKLICLALEQTNFTIHSWCFAHIATQLNSCVQDNWNVALQLINIFTHCHFSPEYSIRSAQVQLYTEMRRKWVGSLFRYFHHQLQKKTMYLIFFYHLHHQASKLLAWDGILLAPGKSAILIVDPWTGDENIPINYGTCENTAITLKHFSL